MELTGICKRYGKTEVLRGASVTCARGAAVCLAGANAAGKTTLLTIAAGLQKADSGDIACDGSIGYVPQECSLLADLTVRDNLALWYAAAGRPRTEIFAEGAAETLLELTPYTGRLVKRLSGGLKKRAEIACALIARPAYLLMDEPFTGLDMRSSERIVWLLQQVKAQGAGLLFASHDPHQIAAVADTVVLLTNGAVDQPVPLEGDGGARVAQVIAMLSGARRTT